MQVYPTPGPDHEDTDRDTARNAPHPEADRHIRRPYGHPALDPDRDRSRNAPHPEADRHIRRPYGHPALDPDRDRSRNAPHPEADRHIRRPYGNNTGFREEDHPRDSDGKFTATGGGGGGGSGEAASGAKEKTPERQGGASGAGQGKTGYREYEWAEDVPLEVGPDGRVAPVEKPEAPEEGHSAFGVISDLGKTLSWDKLTIERVSAMSPMEIVGAGLYNLGPSLGKYAGEVKDTLSDPLEVAGTVKHILEGMIDAAKGVDSDSRRYWDAVCDYLKESYGSFDAIKYKLASDPVGLASDASLFLPMGGGVLMGAGKVMTAASRLAPRAAQATLAKGGKLVEQTGRMAITAGDAVDPLRLGGKAAAQVGGAVARKAGSSAAAKAASAAVGKAKSAVAAKIGPENLDAIKDMLGGTVEKFLKGITRNAPRAVPAGRLALGAATSARSSTRDVKNR